MQPGHYLPLLAVPTLLVPGCQPVPFRWAALPTPLMAANRDSGACYRRHDKVPLPLRPILVMELVPIVCNRCAQCLQAAGTNSASVYALPSGEPTREI